MIIWGNNLETAEKLLREHLLQQQCVLPCCILCESCGLEKSCVSASWIVANQAKIILGWSNRVGERHETLTQHNISCAITAPTHGTLKLVSLKSFKLLGGKSFKNVEIQSKCENTFLIHLKQRWVHHSCGSQQSFYYHSRLWNCLLRAPKGSW